MTMIAPDFLISRMSVSISSIVSALIDSAPRSVNEVASSIGAVVDRQGRLHAPHDGFVFEGIVYRGGEYLPVEHANLTNQRESLRLKMTVEQADKTIAMLEQAKLDCSASKGKEFDGKVYLYINQITAKQKSEVLGLMPQDNIKILLSVEQAKQHRVTGLLGKTFKYSHKKKLANMQYTGNYHNWVIGECEQNHGKICGYLYQRIVD